MNLAILQDDVQGSSYMAVKQRGRALLLNPQTNKGTAFSSEERRRLRLDGLLPPAACSMGDQLHRVYDAFCTAPTHLDKYIYLASLQDRNETLFYRLLYEHIEEMVPIVYTPTVGEACQRFSHIYRRARGVYVSYEHRQNLERILRHVDMERVSLMVVTDGERILGLGDQGAGGMGIPIGKLCLYTLCAGVPPYTALPVMLDVGTDNRERLDDPLYLGSRHLRVRGAEYQGFMDAFVSAVRAVFPSAVLQWEDFLKGNAIQQLDRFRDQLCSFNDDIQGTAAVVVAGLLTSARLTGLSMPEQVVVLSGAGAAAQGIASLLVQAMKDADLEEREACRRIWCVDTHGLVVNDRPGLEDFKARFARDPEEVRSFPRDGEGRIRLEDVIRQVHPTALLGASGVGGLFTETVVRAMSASSIRPVIFALSNPTSNSECHPKQAIEWSEGRAIVATGSPFDPFDYAGKRFKTGQSNNVYCFPGIGLGAIVGRLTRLSERAFLAAAKALAESVAPADLSQGSVYPSLKSIRQCSQAVACAVIRQGVAEGACPTSSPGDVDEAVRRFMWFPEYLPMRYEPAVVLH
jgi:malate dehydrogenase (oxaloacetate-decarboxylating)